MKVNKFSTLLAIIIVLLSGFSVLMPGTVIPRDDLMNIVRGFDYIGGQRTVDVHVSSLRKKLELGHRSVKNESIRGVGYKLVLPRGN